MYIYMISDNKGAVKIGITKNPTRRLKQIQTGHPNKLEIIYKEEFNCTPTHIMRIESKLHLELSRKFKKLQGEWFSINPDDYETVKNQIIFFRIRYEEDTVSLNPMFR